METGNRWRGVRLPATGEKKFVLYWPGDDWQSPPLTENTARDVFMATNGEFDVQLAIIEDGKRRVILSW